MKLTGKRLGFLINFNLFVSSSRDLAAEREMVGQAVAELPVSRGWEIGHTPRPGELAGPSVETAGACDLYLLLLGADLTAPMGVEYRWARRAGREPLAFHKRVPHSPSAQSFLRESGLPWTDFETTAQLKLLVTKALARWLLDHAEVAGLHLPEAKALSLLLAERREEGPPDEREGAGRGAVILERSAG